jgi:hypothetical protein
VGVEYLREFFADAGGGAGYYEDLVKSQLQNEGDRIVKHGVASAAYHCKIN